MDRFPRQAAILVGGLGTRLGAITRDTPKPMIPVGGRPFLAWLLRELCRFGIAEAVLLTGHLSGRVRDGLTALADHLALAAADPPGTVGRMILRAVPDASRYGVVTLDGKRGTAFAERGGPGGGLINSGICLLARAVLDTVRPDCSLERDVLPVLAAQGRLRGAESWTAPGA